MATDNRTMFDKVIDAIIDKAKQQGLSLLLLVAMTIIFYMKVNQLEHKSDACTGRMIEILETTISNNNLMIQKSNDLMLEMKFRMQTGEVKNN